MLVETTPIKNTNKNILLMPDQSQVRQYTSIGSYTIVYVTKNAELVSAKAIESDPARYIDGDDRIVTYYPITDGRPYWCSHLEFWVP